MELFLNLLQNKKDASEQLMSILAGFPYMIIKYDNNIIYGDSVKIPIKERNEKEAEEKFMDDIQLELFTKFSDIFEKVAKLKEIPVNDSEEAYKRVTYVMSELKAQAILGRKAAYEGRNRIVETFSEEKELTAYTLLTSVIRLPELYASKPHSQGKRYGDKEYSEHVLEKARSFAYQVLTEGTWNNELPDKNWNFMQ